MARKDGEWEGLPASPERKPELEEVHGVVCGIDVKEQLLRRAGAIDEEHLDQGEPRRPWATFDATFQASL